MMAGGVGLDRLRTQCNECEKAFELACKGLEGAKTFLDRIKDTLLALEHGRSNLQTINKIDEELKILKRDSKFLN